METPLALKGTLISCDGGHVLYELTSDVFRGGVMEVDQFNPVDPKAQTPCDGAAMEPCPHCGQPWVHHHAGGTTVNFKGARP